MRLLLKPLNDINSSKAYSLSITPFAQTFAELPETLAVFPLSGAVVMPGSYLPLNIFEPRYLTMVGDAMRNNQLIGMIQPSSSEKGGDQPSVLHQIGSCGRIVQYEETLDGRLNIVLNGLCRFRMVSEISSTRGYRVAQINFTDFESDFDEQVPTHTGEYDQLKILLKNFIDKNNYDPKWKDIIDTVEARQIVSNAVSYLPFSPQDKQFLLERVSLDELISATIAIMQTAEAGSTQH